MDNKHCQREKALRQNPEGGMNMDKGCAADEDAAENK